MTIPRRRRALAAALAGTAVVLTGCAVPGQDGSPSTAVSYQDTDISNERVSDLYTAWTSQGHVSVTRRGVLTLEVMREPMLDNLERLGIQYSRDYMEDLAAELMRSEAVEGQPTEELVDGVEAAYLMGAYGLADTTGTLLPEIAQSVEDEAVTSTRTGDFSEAELITTLNLVMPSASNRLNMSDPLWITEFTGVNAFVEPDEDWIASE
ncbi:hypothetical protein [Demequina globuliformis]|uniref:hypothetical protein n=1 Tax=Demequina globuliformis TaxID=676202 RepID=UPI000785E9C7|nr:hypothetical protein [Demequina globuliformis]